MSYSESELFFQENEQLRLIDFCPISKDIFEQVNKVHWDEEHQSMSFEEWGDLLTEHGYDVSKIMVDYRQNVFYIGEYSTGNLRSLDPSWLTMPFTVKTLNKEETVKKDFVNGDYFSTFFPEWNRFAIDFFVKLHKKLDTKKVWETFKFVYCCSDYGFSMFPKEVVEYCVSYADNKEALEQLKELSVVDDGGYITIYRGEGEVSTAIEQAYSWTLSKEVANSFANRFGKGKVYEAKVKLENVIDYDDEREEKEVLVRYEHILDLKECSI